MIVAVKNLVVERTRLILSVVGVGFAVLLILVMAGIFVGTTSQVTTYIDHSRNAVWVVQPGVSQMFRAVSWLPGGTERQLMALPEVASADPILGQPSDFVHDGEQTAYFVEVLEPDLRHSIHLASFDSVRPKPRLIPFDPLNGASLLRRIGRDPAFATRENVVVGQTQEVIAVGFVPVGDHLGKVVAVTPKAVSMQVASIPSPVRFLSPRRGSQRGEQEDDQERAGEAAFPVDRGVAGFTRWCLGVPSRDGRGGTE